MRKEGHIRGITGTLSRNKRNEGRPNSYNAESDQSTQMSFETLLHLERWNLSSDEKLESDGSCQVYP